MGSPPRIEFRVLGDVQISGRSERLTALQKLLLGSLILRGGVLSVDILIDVLWPDTAPKNPRSALQIHASRLRRQLEGTSASLTSTSTGYALSVPDECVDVREFKRLTAAGMAQLAHNPDDGLAFLDEAFAHWKGPPFGTLGAPDQLHLDLVSLEELRVTALEASVKAQADAGRLGAATVTELRQETSRYPLNERLAVLLMRALFDLKRGREALEAYARIHEDLRRELGVSPGLELDDMREKVLADRRRGDTPGPPLSSGFVGRQGECAALDRALDLSEEGVGTLVVVTGEWGMGKSTLVVEAAARASTRGHHVHIGRCTGPDSPPMEALVAVLQSMENARSLPAPPHHQVEIDRLRTMRDAARRHAPDPSALTSAFNALIREAASSRPVVIVIEDVHLADTMTLDVVDALAREVSRASVVVLLSAQTLSIEAGPESAEKIFALSRIPGAQTLALEGLSLPEVAQYIENITGTPPTKTDTDTAVRRTHGNPLFIKALAHAGDLNSAAPPPALSSSLMRVVDALPSHVRQVVQLTAFIRGLASPHVVAEVLGVDVSKVDDAMEVAVVVGVVDGDRSKAGMRIRHPLLAETIVAQTPPEERQRIHRDLAWVYSSRTIPGVRGAHATAGHHWTQAGDTPRGAREYLLAVDDAADTAQYADALSYAERVIDLCAQIDDHDDVLGTVTLAELRVRAANYAMLVGEASRATEHARAAVADGDADRGVHGQRWLTLAEALRHSAGSSAETTNALTHALDLIPDVVSEARVRALLNQMENWPADPDHAAQLGDRAIEYAELIGSPRLLAQALVSAGCAEMVRGNSVGESMAVHGRNIAEQSGSRVGVLRAYRHIAHAHILSGRPDEGANVAMAGLARISHPRHEGSLYAALAQQAIIGCTLAGRWQEIAQLPTALDGDGVFHDGVAEAHAHLWAIKGDLMRSARILQHLKPRRTSPPAKSWLAFYQGRAASSQRIEARIVAAAPYQSAAAHNETVFLAVASLARAARTAHVSPQAQAHTASLLSQLRPDPGGMPAATAWASLAHAEATALGRGAVEAAWRDAWATWTTLNGWPHMRVYLKCRLANVLGPSHEATELLTSAMALVRALGSATLRELTVGAAIHNRIAPDSLELREVQELTPRERDVLEFVVDGASNHRIAKELGLSEKTVSVHVSSLLRKTGAGSRTELALWVLRAA